MKKTVVFIIAFAVILTGCADTKKHSKGVYMLLDTSATYALELKKAQSILNYLLATLQPMDTLAVARIDTESFSEKDIIAKVTFYQRPSVANNQKRAFQKKMDKFTSEVKSSKYTDISGGLSQAVEYLNKADPGKKYILIFSDLKEELKKGNFRDDLYFRLNVIPVYCPSLIERRTDIPLLINHFIEYFSEENNYKKKSFSKKSLDMMINYTWKGNVRELRNLVERLLIMSENTTITENDLPDYLRVEEKPHEFSFQNITSWKQFKQQSEKHFLEEKLKEFRFNIARTAREIQLPRSNLYKKIEFLGIIIPDHSEADEGSPGS